MRREVVLLVLAACVASCGGAEPLPPVALADVAADSASASSQLADGDTCPDQGPVEAGGGDAGGAPDEPSAPEVLPAPEDLPGGEVDDIDAGAPLGCSKPAVQDLGIIGIPVSLTAVPLPKCAEQVFSMAAPKGMTVFAAVASETALEAVVTYPDEPDWDKALAVLAPDEDTVWSAQLEVPRSGELFLRVRAADSEVPAVYDVALQCASGCSLESTRFPIVLVHGWTGFSKLGPIDYFYDIPATLSEKGYPVCVVSLDPYNSIEVRSGQLAAQLDDLLAMQRARRVDIIAHSQGGLDSRRVISTLGYGDRIAALVTVATPHRGTPIADVALGYLPGGTDEALNLLLNLVGAAAGNESDAKAAFHSLSRKYVQEELNPATPDDPQVAYSSWAGKCCPLGIGCGDACDVEIAALHAIIQAMEGDNDGVVPVSSTPWGEFRGVLPADHFDEVGQVLGITNPNFDHREFYLDRAVELRKAGY